MNITSWKVAQEFTIDHGGRFLTRPQMEALLGQPLPVKVMGCMACSTFQGEGVFRQLYFIPLNNPVLRARANRPPYAGVISGLKVPFTVIGECGYCGRSTVYLVVKS